MAEAPWRQAAPPPPPGAVGHIPAGRLKSEVSGRVEPPLCVQNAMLTKDKKPFTYTPGGIDLSEIRSPRMQRRLEMNAMNEGVGPQPQAQPNYPTGPLPPSALAAMQPQLPVQVFPAGGIPQRGAPPPPPPPSCIPPPPRAPPMKSTSPLPTDAFERPDMTKIIPENPMALLRKTSGPVIKRDPIFNKDNYAGGVRPNNGMEVQPRPAVQKLDSPPVRQTDSPSSKVAGIGSIYVPPVNQSTAPPTPPQRNHQVESPNANRVAPPYYKRQPEPQSPPAMAQRQPPAAAVVAQRDPQTPDSPKATLSKAPTPWLSQKRQQSQETPEWAINDNYGQTSPPVEEQFQQKAQIQQEAQPQQKQPRPWQQQPQQQQPQQQQQPPWQQQQPPQPQQQKQPAWQQKQQQEQPEPQPWQQRPKQQPEPQPWQQRQQQPDLQPWQQPQQNRPAQSPPVQIPQGGGVRKQIQNREQPQQSGPTQRTEVVVVNEPPEVFQHPGGGYTQPRVIIRQQQPQQNNFQQQPQGARIIPVQIEGAASNGQVRSPQQQGYPNTPGSNSDARSLNRQLSWNSTPTQSNTFRVLQKITQTDGDDDDDQPVIEHSPKTPQNFPQRQISEQIRKMKQNEGDQELMNKFKQVPQNQQSNNRGPKVRTIPIQMEGDAPSKTYVPPSEQTVQEPKKYMGSSIPSRSFKILQAMTAPDDCVNPERACENNENYPNDPSSYTQWGFDPNYPPPSPYYFDPYWSYYSQNYPVPNTEPSADKGQNNNSRMTPIPPNWGYYSPQYCAQSRASSERSDSDAESVKKRNSSSRTTPVPWQNDNEPAKKQSGNARCTPVPFWPYYYPNYSEQNQEAQQPDTNGNPPTGEEQQNYTQYPPYWDPYYYGYYYGAPPPMYPPVYSPYPFYPPPQNDTEEVSGYSSNDEMSYYGARFASMPQFKTSKTRNLITPRNATTPRNVTTPTPTPNRATTPSLSQQLLEEIKQAAKKMEESRKNREEPKEKSAEKIRIQSEPFDDDSSIAETSDSESEMIGYEVCRKPVGLQAIRSVSDIKVYDDCESSHCSDEEEESEDITEENDDTSSVCAADETIPHQLSVIFEESERTDSAARHVRESSVATTISEGTATVENSEDEEEAFESDGTVLVKLPLTFKFSVAESQKVATLTVGNSQVMPQVATKGTIREYFDDKYISPSKRDNYVKLKQVSCNNSEAAERNSKSASDDSDLSNRTISNYSPAQITAYEEEDVDWWEEISKCDDLSKSISNVEQDSAVENPPSINSANVPEIRIEASQNDCTEQEYISASPNNGSSESEDFWRSIKEDEWSRTTQLKDVQENSIEAPCFQDYNNGLEGDGLPKENEAEEVDLWTSLKTDEVPQVTQEVHEALCTNPMNEEHYISFNDMEAKESVSVSDNANGKPSPSNELNNDLNEQQSADQGMAVNHNSINANNPTTLANENSEEMDFWAEIISTPEEQEVTTNIEKTTVEQEISDLSSVCSRNSSLNSSKVSEEHEQVHKISNFQESHEAFSCEDNVKTEERSHCSEIANEVVETQYTCDYSTNLADQSEIVADENPDDKPLSVQERIKVLQAAATYKQSQQQEEETEVQFSVKERISVFEDNVHLNTDKTVQKRKSVSRKNSVKSYEEYSEEEGDSGVTSDVSRHVSEADMEIDFVEAKKNKYQRASTHSRLFRLLQDECDNEDEENDDVIQDSLKTKANQVMQHRREHLNLPLQKNGSDPESFSSSGFTSPGSPTINDRLVSEIIQTLLLRKQGRVFKNVTMEKLQAAALRILQDDMDGLETLSSSEDGGSFLSPKKPGTASSTPAQTPQEFAGNFNEYSQYYESWAQAERLYEAQCDVLPSKAFRLIQDHAALNKTGAIAGLLARCPRVLSNKNVQKELMKLIEAHESPSPSPVPLEQPPDANEAMNAS